MSDPLFGDLVYAVLDDETPVGWRRVQGVIAVPSLALDGLLTASIQVPRCLDVSAKDDAGVVLVLSPAEEEAYGRLFVEFYVRRVRRGL